MNTRAVTRYYFGGKYRTVRLYKAWVNMRDRCAGRIRAGSGKAVWLGVEIEFRDWAHFREWSLANGYCRARNSLDRVDPYGPYSPENCRWVSVSENSSWANVCKFLRDEEVETYGNVQRPDWVRGFIGGS